MTPLLNHLLAAAVGFLAVLTVWSHVSARLRRFKKGDKIQQIAEEKWHTHPILEILDVGKKKYLVKVYGVQSESFELLKSKVNQKFVRVRTWSDVK